MLIVLVAVLVAILNSGVDNSPRIETNGISQVQARNGVGRRELRQLNVETLRSHCGCHGS